MKAFCYGMLAVSVMSLGFWAYQENYETQAALREARSLRAQVATAQARLDRLDAEWAYLNRPDRLADLAHINFARLQLLPLRPEAFADLDAVAHPPTTLGPITSALTVSSDGAGTGARPWEEPL
jgi:hypothetical protein